MMDKKITVLLIEDHRLVREVWTTLLNDHGTYEVVSANSSAEEGLEAVTSNSPDIVVVDINLPGMNGIDVVPLIREASPVSRIIGISTHTVPAYVKGHDEKWGNGLPHKKLLTGRIVLRVGGSLRGATICLLGDCKYVAKGFSSRSTGILLNISPKTVKVHRYNILRKLKVKNTVLLVEYIHANYSNLLY